MVASLQSLILALESMGITPQPNRRPHCYPGSPYLQFMKHHYSRRRKQKNNGGGLQGVSTERRCVLEGTTTSMSRVGKRVRELRRLVPNGEEMELDGLFSEATDYIACMQMQVKVMRILVEVLQGSDE